MKNFATFLLIFLLVLPTFASWLPHGAVHALHDQQARHHVQEGHSHGHQGHDHDIENQEAVHHPIHLDAVTYFTDYLHVDLQSPGQIVLKAPEQESHDIAFFLPPAFKAHRYELALFQARSPPDWRRRKSQTTPLYFSTRRIRI